MSSKTKEIKNQIAWLDERIIEARKKGDARTEDLMVQRRRVYEEALVSIWEQEKNQVGFFFKRDILNKQLGPIAGQFGGRLCILEPSCTPPAKLSEQFAACGYSIEQLRQDARWMFLEDMADSIYEEWKSRE